MTEKTIDLPALGSMAADCGFTVTAALDVATLRVMPEVRDMCASDRCGHYGRSWSCPPACGSLEEMERRIRRYSRGILVQTVGELEDSFDWEGMQETKTRHDTAFRRLWQVLLEPYPGLTALGAGCCELCSACAWPEPCRFPDRRMVSMEACGLFVSQVCRENGVKYNYGPDRIAYTSCFLLV